MGPSRSLFSRFAFSFLRALLLIWFLSASTVFLWGLRDAAAPADAIVVLGAAQYAGRPSPVLRARLDHAFLLWKEGLAPRVILTGGKAEGDMTTEAAVGRLYLKRQGVPDSAMMLEKQGRSTEESLEGVAHLMKEAQIDRVIFVSDPFHMLRLQILAWRYRLHAVPSPTRTSPISAKRSEALWYIGGESLKVP
ncbi:MAG: YdcF family protein, partial [Gemmatimonadaceae bacterium]